MKSDEIRAPERHDSVLGGSVLEGSVQEGPAYREERRA